MEPLFELPITLPPKGSRELLRAVYSQLREAILDGRLHPNTRLPSTRAFAAAVGVSRNTTVAVYDLLLSEGYLTVRPGSGTYVAAISPRPAAARRGCGGPAPGGEAESGDSGHGIGQGRGGGWHPPLCPRTIRGRKARPNGLVLGYGMIRSDRIGAAIEQLARIMSYLE